MEERFTNRLRDFTVLTLLKLVGFCIVEIVLLRVVAPYLFDLHDTLALALAVVVALVAVAVLIWFAFDLTKAFRRYRRFRGS